MNADKTATGRDAPGNLMGDVLEGPALACVKDRVLRVEHGVIAAIAPAPPQAGPRRLLAPGLVNAHDHARPLSTTSFGGSGLPLESWLIRIACMPAVDPYLAAAAAFGRAARGGCVSVMAHYTRAMGPMPLAEEAREVARAGADVGIRAAFAVVMRDRDPLIYGPSEEILADLAAADRHAVESLFPPSAFSIREQIERVEAVAEAAEGPFFNVQFGPAGPQWCSTPLLEAIAEASERSNRRVHMHCLETRYQREWADRHHPEGLLRHLKSIGLLSPRLTLAHCVYARPDDLDLIAEAGATIVTNTSSNLHLRSGLAPIGEAIKRGCRVAMGVDSAALDEDDDSLRELRLGHLLHGGWGFEETISRAAYWARCAANGRAANGAPGAGALAPGEPADMLALDLAALDRDGLIDIDPLDLVLARANAGHILRVIVAGKTIVDNGAVVGVDLPAIEAELRRVYRHGLADRAPFLAAWPALEPRLRRFYRERLGCC